MERRKAVREMGLMGFIMILSLSMIYYIIPNYIKLTSIQAAESFTARTWPTLISWGMLIVSAIGFLSAATEYFIFIKKNGRAAQEKLSAQELKGILFPYLIYVLIVAYGLLFRYTGYLIATVLIPPIMLWFLNCRKWQMYALLYAFGIVVFILFKFVLRVPLRLI